MIMNCPVCGSDRFMEVEDQAVICTTCGVQVYGR